VSVCNIGNNSSRGSRSSRRSSSKDSIEGVSAVAAAAAAAAAAVAAAAFVSSVSCQAADPLSNEDTAAAAASAVFSFTISAFSMRGFGSLAVVCRAQIHLLPVSCVEPSHAAGQAVARVECASAESEQDLSMRYNWGNSPGGCTAAGNGINKSCMEGEHKRSAIVSS